MNRPLIAVVLASAAAISAPVAARPQEAPTPQSNGLNVFLDCYTYCDFDHFRREIPFVNYVRDRSDAQVHVLVTSQSTGGGGQEYRFTFIGLRQFAGREDTLHYVAGTTDTNDEERDGQTRALKLGLMRYVANTPIAERIEISYRAPELEEVPAQPADDPWNFWVFRVSAGGSFDAESQQRFYRVNGSASATRTTEAWKMYIAGRGQYSRSRYELEEDSVAVYTDDTYSLEGRLIRSLAGHWGAGVRTRVEKSIRYNQDFAARLLTGVEFSAFPYDESTRRAVTILYSVGVAAYNYEEITVFQVMSETRFQQALELSVSAVQPWGNMGASLEAATYLHDLHLHRIDVGVGLSLRLARGLELNLGSNAARIKDQIYLSGAGIPEDEILLHRRALGTDYEVGLGFSLSFTFGSIFNNVVNPRMDDFR